jgi:phosphate starvation-inducible membrane PsiE
MRKILAILFTLVSIFAIKETFYIFTTTDAEVVHKKVQFGIVAISITLPLLLLTLWLWNGKRKEQE